MPQHLSIKDKTFIFQKEDSIDSASFCEEYLKLYSDCFGNRSYISEKWFKWSNIDNPYGKNNIYTVRNFENNEIAASYTLSPFMLNFNNTSIHGYLCCNVMTSPSYTGMGLFTQIGEYALKNSILLNEIALGIPNESAIKGHLKVGWQVMSNLFFIEKRKADFIQKKTDAYVTENISELENYDFSLFNKHSNFNLQKNYLFLQWRYANNPKNKYQFVVLKTNNIVKGYAVIKTYLDEITKLNKVHIVEYAYHELDQLNMILYAIENYAIGIHSDLINTWSFCQEESLVYKLFIEKNYKQMGDSNYCIIYANTEIKKELSNWQIMLGDNDVY